MTQNHDIFRDSLSIFLDYINRKLKLNPDYEFHPLIKALINALEAVKEAKIGESVVGLSGETNKNKYFNPYIVAITKNSNGVEIKEITELTTNKKVPLDVMVSIFRLQIHLDKIPQKYITPLQSTEILNHVFPEYHFYNLGDKWMEARDLFTKRLKEGKVSLPSSLMTDELIKEFTEIRYNTPWNKYSSRVRSLIAGMAGEIFDARGNTIIMSAPTNAKVPKYKVFEFASQLLMGQGSKYLRDENCLFCKRKNVEEYVLSIEENFVILADKFPLSEKHILVVSKKHVRAIGDLENQELEELEDIIVKVGEFYKSKNEEFVMFESGSTGQSVYHAHMHFLPGQFYISEAIKSYKIQAFEIKELSEIVEKYRKLGRYILWMEKGKMFLGLPNDSLDSKSFFRNLVAMQLLKINLVDWTKLSEDEEYIKSANRHINSTKQEWTNAKQ